MKDIEPSLNTVGVATKASAATKMTPAKGSTTLVIDDTERIAVIAIYSQLNQSEQECFLYRVVRNRTSMIFLRELFYWFSPGKKAGPLAPRASVRHRGKFWVSRTKTQWKDDQEISRGQIETIHQQIRELGLCEIAYFRFGYDRTTHYTLVFSKWFELLHDDFKVQAIVAGTETAGGDSTRTGNAGSIPQVLSGHHLCGAIPEAPQGGPPLNQVSGTSHSTTTTVSSPAGCSRDANASLGAKPPRPPAPPVHRTVHLNQPKQKSLHVQRRKPHPQGCLPWYVNSFGWKKRRENRKLCE